MNRIACAYAVVYLDLWTRTESRATIIQTQCRPTNLRDEYFWSEFECLLIGQSLNNTNMQRIQAHRIWVYNLVFIGSFYAARMSYDTQLPVYASSTHYFALMVIKDKEHAQVPTRSTFNARSRRIRTNILLMAYVKCHHSQVHTTRSADFRVRWKSCTHKYTYANNHAAGALVLG